MLSPKSLATSLALAAGRGLTCPAADRDRGEAVSTHLPEVKDKQSAAGEVVPNKPSATLTTCSGRRPGGAAIPMQIDRSGYTEAKGLKSLGLPA